jgi:hypothetical protein
MSATRTLLTALVALLVAGSGCGGSGAPAASTSNQAGTQPVAPPKPSAPPVDSTLLQRKTPRPPGVSEQFDYVGGAGPGACFEVGASSPHVSFSAAPFSVTPARPGTNSSSQRATIGQAVDICFNGFGRGPVHVVVNGPSGRTMSGDLARWAPKDASNGAWPGYDWVPVIDESWPLGRYVVMAQSPDGRASTTFVLAAPTQPGVRVVGPSTDPGHNEVASNSLAKIFLVGFRGKRSVRLVIYKTKGFGPGAAYFSSAEVPMSPSGNAVVMLPTGRASGNATFIATAMSGGETLSAAFSVTKPFEGPGSVVGALPQG